MTPFYRFALELTRLAFFLFYKVTYIGREKIPAAGGYLIVANHQCMKDPFLVAHGARRQVYFMAKQEYFGPFTGWLFRWVGAFPVDRGTGDLGAIDRAAQLIQEGRLVGLFPEGTRNRTVGPMKAKSGAALIARQTKADIIPCGISFDDSRGFRSRMTVCFGDPIPYESLGFEDQESPASLRKVSKRIAQAVNDLRTDLPKEPPGPVSAP